jgi:hypothetical protein
MRYAIALAYIVASVPAQAADWWFLHGDNDVFLPPRSVSLDAVTMLPG